MTTHPAEEPDEPRVFVASEMADVRGEFTMVLYEHAIERWRKILGDQPRDAYEPRVPTAEDCICDLIDVTTLEEQAEGRYTYVRGYSRGCPVHHAPTGIESGTAARSKEMERREAEGRAAAMRRAREAP